jgi:hypothetical protein
MSERRGKDWREHNEDVKIDTLDFGGIQKLRPKPARPLLLSLYQLRKQLALNEFTNRRAVD